MSPKFSFGAYFFSNTGDFTNTGAGTCSTTLAASSTCTYTVTFGPTGIGARSTTFTVTDSAGTQTSTLSGTGTAQATVSPTSLNFGNVVNGSGPSSQQTVTLTNNGATSITSLVLSLTGTNASVYNIAVPASGTNCNTTSTLTAGSSCVAAVTFSPVTVANGLDEKRTIAQITKALYEAWRL